MSTAADLIADLLASGHGVRFRADGDSMYPLIRSGETLLVEPCRPDQIGIGDVVLARLERGLTAHRVIRVELDQQRVVRFFTRGDNCRIADPPFSPAQLLGKVAGRTDVHSGISGLILRLFAYRWVRGASQ